MKCTASDILLTHKGIPIDMALAIGLIKFLDIPPMKQKKFSVVKAVKAKARKVLGQPKPTHIRSGRKASTRLTLDPDLNQPNLAANPHYIPREDHIEGAPRLSTSDQLHITVPVALKKPREGPRPKTPCLQYSPEVIQHINVLRKQCLNAIEAQKAVDQYLASLKERDSQTMHSQLAEKLTREHEAPQPVDGAITAALKDAELKVAFFENEIRRNTQEAERWRQVAGNLKSAIKLTMGEVSMPKPKTGEKRERGYWASKVKSVLNRTGQPMLRTELQKILGKEEGTLTIVYPAVHSLIKTGVLVEIDGKLVLPEWTEPANAN